MKPSFPSSAGGLEGDPVYEQCLKTRWPVEDIVGLRASGEKRPVAWGQSPEGEEPVSAIITGVLRAGRDDYPEAIARLCEKRLDYFDPKRVD